MWKGAFFFHFLPAINSIFLPNSNRTLHFPFSLSFSSFFLLFLSSHLPCPSTLFARDPILFSPTGNTILTRSEVQLTMDDRSSHFSRKIPRKRLKKCHCFGKNIYDRIQSQWIDISCFDLACIAFQWVVNYIDIKKKHFIWTECKWKKIKKDWVFVQNLMLTKRNVQLLFFKATNTFQRALPLNLKHSFDDGAGI